MLDLLLERKNISARNKVIAKSLISLLLISLSFLLPQLVHIVAGSMGGVKWLPMYLPVIIGGALLGPTFSSVVAILSPLGSFLLTSSFGQTMPSLERLPFMMVELLVFALTVSLFSRKIMKEKKYAFIAVALAFILGRATLLLTILLFDFITPLNINQIWAQVYLGLPGVALQLIICPLVIVSLSHFLKGEENE